MNITLLVVVSVLHYVAAETGMVFHGPPQARELFSFNDRLYYFYSDSCSYEEAKAICDANNMHLATLEDPAKAKFAAESIAEAWMVFEDMWIGATKGERGQWKWDFIQKRIPEEPQMTAGFNYLYPPWIDNEVPSRDGKDCLAIDRNGHSDPYFIDLDCTLPRPFICEQNIHTNATDPWNSGSVQIYNLEYILYHGRLTWSSAVSFCRQQGFALATIDNMSVARKLANAMLKSRPEFEDAWIGANLKDDQWVWVESGDEIRTIPAEYKDSKKGDTPDNIVTPQFPPWFNSKPRKGRECVIFDRHLCEEPRFIHLKCNRQRDFICIKRQQSEIKTIKPKILDREKKRYIFFPVAATWNEAKQICDEQGDDSTMLNLTDIDQTKFVIQAMADSRKPMDHIWLGGKIINDEWYWIGKSENGEDNKLIPKIPDETGFPPWCDNETNLDMSCLNLDRQNHWTPLIYGLECNSTQAVVCVQPIQPNDKIVQYEGPNEHDPQVQLRITKLVSNPVSWHEAGRACSREVGKLWKPKFDLVESRTAINKLYTTLQKSQESKLVVYHVDGGQYSSKKKAWIRNDRTLNITTEWRPYDGDCLVGQVQNTSNNWVWFPVQCHHKLYSQIICEPYCSLSEVPYEADNSEWICDATGSNIFDHKMTGMGCNHRCPVGLVTVGPERFYCSKRGWFSNQAAVSVKASACKNVEDGLKLFEDIPEGITSLVFVIDSTADSPLDYSATKYLMANLIDYYRSKLSTIFVSVISMEIDAKDGDGAVVKISSYVPTGNCDQIRKDILDVLVDTGEGARDFFAVIKKIKYSLNNTALDESHIVFIVPEGNKKIGFKEKARIININAKVFAIGTNKHVYMNQLVDLASKQNDKSFAVRFNKALDVVKAVKALKTTCKNCNCSSAYNYLVADIEQKKGNRVITEDEDDLMHSTTNTLSPPKAHGKIQKKSDVILI